MQVPVVTSWRTRLENSFPLGKKKSVHTIGSMGWIGLPQRKMNIDRTKTPSANSTSCPSIENSDRGSLVLDDEALLPANSKKTEATLHEHRQKNVDGTSALRHFEEDLFCPEKSEVCPHSSSNDISWASLPTGLLERSPSLSTPYLSLLKLVRSADVTTYPGLLLFDKSRQERKRSIGLKTMGLKDASEDTVNIEQSMHSQSSQLSITDLDFQSTKTQLPEPPIPSFVSIDFAPTCETNNTSHSRTIRASLNPPSTNTRASESFAYSPSRESPSTWASHDTQEQNDAELARALQDDEDQRAAKARANLRILATYRRRASHFVDKIHNRVDELISMFNEKESLPGKALMDNCFTVEAFSKNDMLFLTEVLLANQQSFKRANKPSQVDIGFHYTHEDHLRNIRMGGLVSEIGLNTHSLLRSIHTGIDAALPAGIYTANNPVIGQDYGDVGLIVARLKGTSLQISTTDPSVTLSGLMSKYDSIIGSKHTADPPMSRSNPENQAPRLLNNRDYHAEVILLNPSQCLPIAHFSKRSISSLAEEDIDSVSGDVEITNYANSIIRMFQAALQEIIDECFNFSYNNDTTDYGVVTTRSVGDKESWIYVSPDSLDDDECLLEASVVPPPSSFLLDERCPICLDRFSSSDDADTSPSAVKLHACGHIVHLSCITNASKFSRLCPVCRKCVWRRPRGTSPSGTMTIQRIQTLPPSPPTIIRIKYQIPGDLQKSFHCNPGRFFQGTSRTAYLPDSIEGNLLLKRLVYAFLHGLTFQVTPSMTTSTETASLSTSTDTIDEDTITWGSIPHKTKRNNSAIAEGSQDFNAMSDGFPDDNYFVTCNRILDHLGVPRDPEV